MCFRMAVDFCGYELKVHQNDSELSKEFQQAMEGELPIRIISMPSWELFDAQSQEYLCSILGFGSDFSERPF